MYVRSAVGDRSDHQEVSVKMSRPSSMSESPITTMKPGTSKSGRAKGLKDIRIDEEVKIAVNIALERFRYSDEKEMEFPSSLTSTERAFIHRYAQSLGLITKSRGKGAHRSLTIRKKDDSEACRAHMSCYLTQNTKRAMRNLFQQFPVTSREMTELLPKTERGNVFAVVAESREISKTSGRLTNGIPQVPLKRGLSDIDSFRQSLPVFQKVEEIVQTIKDNKVVLFVGETGSGKTTQIPQFILDDCYRNGTACRIFCTQPRRLAAIAVAERVAAERGEKIGQTIGYQIRLESVVSPKTLLIFCTNGVLLRTLMTGDTTLSTVTHVIVDEVHERDRFSDFLLTKLRDLIPKHPTLKLILSSAALDVNLFLRYFEGCPVLYIQGRPFEVKEMFLEDILGTTSYTNKDMLKYKTEKQCEEKQKTSLSEWHSVKENSIMSDTQRQRSITNITEDYDLLDDEEDIVFSELIEKDVNCLEPWLIKEMDSCLSDIWLHKDVDAFAQLFQLILTENVSVDYKHSGTSASPLMVAAGQGFLSQLEQLIGMGANVHNKASNGWTALDWARHFKQSEVVDLLESYSASLEPSTLDESSLVQAESSSLSVEEQELLKAYHYSFDDEKVDLDLIMHILHYICQNSDSGAILIFLPGYDEIVGLRDHILYDDKRFTENSHRYQIFMLHSNMQTSDQKNVLKTPPSGIRKIILSTNIAETSITVNDVVFVIDSGKVKEKSYDALNHVTMLKMVWISKASAIQRKGRAGRCQPGVCFRLFSRLRFQNMLEFQTPELLRMPLHELCLHAKLLAPINCPIADFLMKAPEPPPALIVRNAVQMLKTIDAMDAWEDLTELGYHLADLPLEPHLGKMVLCAVVLKCLDPILTIACTLAYRDPFVLPTQASQKCAAMLCRKRFTAGTFSDHMALLRAFQAWQKARSDGWERVFCEKNFLSQATMEIIIGMRIQLLGQLRAAGLVRARGTGDIRDVNTNSENWAVVKAALVAGMYPNLIHVDRENMVLTSHKEKRVRFHPSSVLSQPQYKKQIPPENGQAAAIQALPTDWLIYDEMTRAHRIANIRCCSLVTPASIIIFSGPARLSSNSLQEPSYQGTLDGNESSDSEMEDRTMSMLATLKLDEWLHFKLDLEAANLLLQLRQKWYSLLLRRMKATSKPWSPMDEATIRAVITVLTTEEQSIGLQQPSGIGQRPRPMPSEELPLSSSWTTNPSHKSLAETDFSDDLCSVDSRTIKSSSLTFSQQPKHKERVLQQPKRLEEKTEQLSAKYPERSSCTSPSASPSPPSVKSSKSPSPRPNMLVKYFIMKSSNQRNLDISQQKGIWSTIKSNERKLNRAFWESSTVYLVFSVQGSGHFQGFARMCSEIGQEKSQDWGSPSLGGVFKVEWIRKESLPFLRAHHLLNPWNYNKKVQISRDGQELEPLVGKQLLLLWDRVLHGDKSVSH
ncbi:3'-5' RNA helicase YTHDC2 isoform X3 [Rhinoderma darwinii]|uniref:3'-5' RNA helicase YTHDC2 isoform X3 n=1 Tax=Rhinoderma darwinii TaxID=43563 RepID=UPI003F66160C